MVICHPAQAQFSPGRLTRAHQALEGVSRCTRCHESGQEISGARCLSCHAEIRARIEKGRGYHFTVRARSCIRCHTEHIGRTSDITRFDARHFDHTRTGFALTGRHAPLACERCHTAAHITEPDIRKILTDYPHKTYLGVTPGCTPCHADRHGGTLGSACETCHGTQSWPSVGPFDHARTRFALTGRHRSVACARCHVGLEGATKTQPLLFDTRPFQDCRGCHASPHSPPLGARPCASCHTPAGWSSVPRPRFDHALTGFPLVGAHAVVSCRQCHGDNARGTFADRFSRAKTTCAGCHEDPHQGTFRDGTNPDCAGCHTTVRFSPSTFSRVEHQQTRFPLTGAHVAVLCTACHRQESGSGTSFHFSSLRCESCHQDPHQGRFTRNRAGMDCAACHTTRAWTTGTFDHDKTRFPLVGRHRKAHCERCHIPHKIDGGETARRRTPPMECRSCHPDVHAGQFERQGRTRCASCHRPEGWRRLRFDHNTRSRFPLTGAHAGVECGACHPKERRGGRVFTRYKPLSTACASCHRSED